MLTHDAAPKIQRFGIESVHGLVPAAGERRVEIATAAYHQGQKPPVIAYAPTAGTA